MRTRLAASVARALDRLARAMGAGGRARTDEALGAAQRSLAIRERHLGAGDPEVATGLNTLGSILRLRYDLEGARAALERALAIRERAYGPNDLSVASTLVDLGLLHIFAARYIVARPLFERALAIRERRGACAGGSRRPAAPRQLRGASAGFRRLRGRGNPADSGAGCGARSPAARRAPDGRPWIARPRRSGLRPRLIPGSRRRLSRAGLPVSRVREAPLAAPRRRAERGGRRRPHLGFACRGRIG